MNDQDKWANFLRDSRTKYERDTMDLPGIPGYNDGSPHKFPVVRIIDSKLILPRRVLEALIGSGVVAEQIDLGNHVIVFDPGTYKYIVAITVNRVRQE